MTPQEARFLFLFAIATAGCATSRPTGAPAVKLNVPPSFAHSLAVQHFQRGEDVLHIDWMRTPATAAMTRYKAYWSAEAQGADTKHGWTIDVYSMHSAKVADAYEHASDGYVADLDELIDFLSPPRPRPAWPGENPRHALSYLFARFERKEFRWGHAVSFFSQGVQDTSMPEPANGRLEYEIFGVTTDGRYTLVAHLSASHPNLPDDANARNMRDNVRRDDPDFEPAYNDTFRRNDSQLIRKLQEQVEQREEAAMRNQPGVKLIETCSPDEFEPSLTAFDQMVDSLAIR